MSEEEKSIIPGNEEGAQSNTEASANFASTHEAKLFYEVVKHRLININQWHHVAGALSADFKLTDVAGNEVDRHPIKGDHFKIDIPGPGSITGDGYDWVKIEEIEEKKEVEEESISILVRPATNPTNALQDIAHFFSEDATSCFIVQRNNTTVTAGVYGRNEKPNTGAEKAVDKARNTAIATGAVTVFSKLQWKSLVNGLVKND